MRLARRRDRYLMESKYEEYEGDYLTFGMDDDDCLRALREEARSLPLAERRIFIMYVEAGTYSEVAKQLHCSVPTVSKKIRAIKEKLIEKTRTVCTGL